MSINFDNHGSCFSAPEQSEAIVHKSMPPPSQPIVVIPKPTDNQPTLLPDSKNIKQNRDKSDGLSLAWRGLSLLGITIGIVAVWYVASWIHHGSPPMTQPLSIGGIGCNRPTILPPDWLMAVTGLLTIISFLMMLIGTHNATPRIDKKDMKL